jgi:hypothetical protein
MSSGGKRSLHSDAITPSTSPLWFNLACMGLWHRQLVLGELDVLGHAGSEVLDGVLHFPNLVVSLLSVRAALATGMAAHFCPATSPDTKEKVYIERGGSVVFSAREHGGMYYIEAQACAASAMAWGSGVGGALAPQALPLGLRHVGQAHTCWHTRGLFSDPCILCASAQSSGL